MTMGTTRERLKPIFDRLFRVRLNPSTSALPKVWREWSIGMYSGDSPFELRPISGVSNPVLTAKHVTDVPAEFVADPFMVQAGPRWHMFFEVWNTQTQKGEIGLAASDDAKSWTYQGIVLAEPFHMSYPYVFEWEGTYYMIPETRRANCVRLYQALDFPSEWKLIRTLLADCDLGDSSIFYTQNSWWLFAGTGVPPYRADTLHLFYAENLLGQWRRHPKSPVVEKNVHIARPAGRVLVEEERVVRYAQDCDGGYGLRVRAMEITDLTTRSYREREIPESPILSPTGSGWNTSGMHHIDPHPLSNGRWLACADGQIAHHREEIAKEGA